MENLTRSWKADKFARRRSARKAALVQSPVLRCKAKPARAKFSLLLLGG